MPWPVKLDVKADVTRPLEDLTATVVSASAFVGKVMGPAVAAGGGIVSDQFMHWRAANIERLRLKWLSRRNQRGVGEDAIRHLPFDLGVRLFEAASGEDDEQVQELWAALLDRATDPNSTEAVRRVHVDILKSISGIEARILLFLQLREKKGDREPRQIESAEVADFAKLELSPVAALDRAIAVQNLKRQECVRRIVERNELEMVERIEHILAPGINVSKEGFIDVVTSLKRLIEGIGGVRDYDDLGNPDGFPELSFELTELGRDLMRICSTSSGEREPAAEPEYRG